MQFFLKTLPQGVKNGTKSSKFLADLTNLKWRILADFYIRSGGFEICLA
jgi:hypothetical protein